MSSRNATLLETGNFSATSGSELAANLTFLADEGRDSLYVIVPMTLFYSIIFITGVIGNVSTCIVIFYNKYMHTATNFYLFSLAVSDLVLLLSALPKEVYELWFRYSYVFGEVSCILQGFASESATNATVLTITAFTIERYVAICHPFMSQTVSKLSRAVKHIIIIWLMALCLAIPQAVQFGIVNRSGQVECTVIPSVMDHAFEISSLVFFVIPMCVISVLYIMIGFRLRSSKLIKQVSPGNFRTRQFTKNQTRVIRMLVAVVVAFIICWAPFHAQRLVAIYGLRSAHPSSSVLTLYSVLTYISGILYYLSATINPILYNIMSNRFRRAFKLTFGHLCRCCISKRKRNNYLIRSRSGHTCRANHQYQASTPRSSLSQKEEIPLHNSRKQNGVLTTKTSFEEKNLLLECAKTTDLLSPPAAGSAAGVASAAAAAAAAATNSSGISSRHEKIKKERSPILVIKAKLNAIKPLSSLSSSSSSRSAKGEFRSVDDLCESKFTEIEFLTHTE